MKCPSCNAECTDGAKFCEECGTAIPQQKECPKCHTVLKPTAKFCFECGYKFTAKKSAVSSASPKNMNIGDKNVIAGDVIGSQDAYHISGGATFITNSDDTKKLVQCHVCGRNILLGEASNCPICHAITCNKCFDSTANMCKGCLDAKHKDIENQFIQLLEKCYEDGRISLAERQELDQKKKLYGIEDHRAFELENTIKNRLCTNKDSKVLHQPTPHERTIIQRAQALFYEEAEFDKALELLTPFYEKYPLDEQVLSLNIAIMAKKDAGEAQLLINSVSADVLSVYLTAAELSMASGDWSLADEKLSKAEALWPDHFLIGCHKVLCLIGLGKKLNIEEFYAEAAAKFSSLPPPANALEYTWQFKAQLAISELFGDEVPKIDKDYCISNNLYWGILRPVSKKISPESNTFTISGRSYSFPRQKNNQT